MRSGVAGEARRAEAPPPGREAPRRIDYPFWIQNLAEGGGGRRLPASGAQPRARTRGPGGAPLRDARRRSRSRALARGSQYGRARRLRHRNDEPRPDAGAARSEETRLNSSHPSISYAVFCLKKKKFPANLASST